MCIVVLHRNLAVKKMTEISLTCGFHRSMYYSSISEPMVIGINIGDTVQKVVSPIANAFTSMCSVCLHSPVVLVLCKGVMMVVVDPLLFQSESLELNLGTLSLLHCLELVCCRH